MLYLHKSGYFPIAVIFCAIFTIVVMAFSGSGYAATIYVDDDAPNDPGPGNPAVSDLLENGSAEHPYDAIQQAIDAAVAGDTVLVDDGEYTGTGNNGFNFKGKGIAVRGQNGARNCIVNLQQTTSGIRFTSGETSSAVLDGLTITGHYGYSNSYYRASVYIQNSSPRIRIAYSPITATTLFTSRSVPPRLSIANSPTTAAACTANQ